MKTTECTYCGFTIQKAEMQDGLCKDCFKLGAMGDFDDTNKPMCDCSNSLVTSIGKTGNWKWSCLNCSKIFV